MILTSDHHGCYLSGEPFDIALEDPDLAVITLPAGLKEELRWEDQLAAANTAISSGKMILWELDFALAKGEVSFRDTAAFFSFTLAIEEFTKAVYPLFKEKSIGVLFFRGRFDFAKLFPLSVWEEEYLATGLGESPRHYRLYCAQIFSEYLHRLLSFLPDEVIPFLDLEISSEISPAERAQLFSRERFEYVHFLPLKALSTQLGVVLPEDSFLDQSAIEELDQILAELSSNGYLFRIIAEGKLTEEWDGIEELIALANRVSSQGKRKLLGFIAAGGRVHYSDSLDLAQLSK